ncbi:MAG: hypothetical protein ABII06_20505, partial [Pseudomonadota bacterium]
MKKIRKSFPFFLMIGLLCLTGACATLGNRRTPVVEVVKQYAPSVVNIRTESIVNLKDTPEWGLYGEAMDEFFKQQFGDEYSEGTLRYKSVGSGV